MDNEILLTAIFVGVLVALLIFLERWLQRFKLSKISRSIIFTILILLLIPIIIFKGIVVESLVQSWANRKEVHSLDRELQKIPVLQLISQAEPEMYAQILREVRNRKLSQQERIATVRNWTLSLLGKYFPLASDQATVDYLKFDVNLLEQLSQKDPSDCFNLAFQRKESPPPLLAMEHISKETREAYFKRQYEVFYSAIKMPQARPDPTQAQKLIALAFSRLLTTQGKGIAVLQHLSDPNIDKSEACRMAILFSQEILKFSEKESSVVFRHLFSQGL